MLFLLLVQLPAVVFILCDNWMTLLFVKAYCYSEIYLTAMFRSTHRRCSVRKGVLRNFAKFTGKHLCQRLFFNKVAGLRPATLLKKSLWHMCFPVNFAKFLRTPFLQNTSGRLLLHVVAFFEPSVMKEVRILDLHNNSTILILKFQNKAVYTS